MPIRLSTLKRQLFSLKGRLLLGLLATWGVVTVMLLGFGWQTGNALLEDSSHAHLRYEARLIADSLTHEVDSRLAALERLTGRLDAGRRDDAAFLEGELRHNDALLEWFEALLVTDAEGQVVAGWPRAAALQGLALGDRSYFRHVRHFRRPHVSEPIVSRVSGQPLVMFAVPRLDDDGSFQGMVGGAIRLDRGGLFKRLERLRLGDQGYASVISASGRVLYLPREGRESGPLPEASLPPSARLALLGWEGETRGTSLKGGQAYQAYRQIWPADWIVNVVLPRGQMMAPLNGWLERLIEKASIITLVMLPIVLGFLWLALRPLFRLETQIEEVGAGQRERVTLSTSMHELEQLAETFNRVEAERSRALASLRDRQAFLDAILASSPSGMFVTDTRGTIRFMNPALVELTGVDAAGQPHDDWMTHVHPDDRQAALDLWRYSMQTGEDFLQQYRYVPRGGEPLWLEVHASRVAIDGRSIGFVGTVKDITERREEEALRQWEAEHDPLTGLLNRRGFERRLEEALADWKKTGTPSALLLFDLDHFKPINDEGGHALGDEMLRRIAQVIAWEVRRSDHVARQGGDEFAVLLPSCTPGQAEKIAHSLREAVREVGVQHQGVEYRVTLSLGVTSFQEGDQRIATVIERADAASYTAKRQGRDRVVAHEVEA
ncbi:diguanylate cyclase [Halomonas koreensis]|uniref:Diguanylate cyclase n=1 Tax=Halomonas koreensis TaxID=245385 RepID=A0ABU1G5E8_9GAMM|nr:diguanylate cyclase [Halomonas koreensis]MDR5868149.1 diguanylate cyclase [Halomonas koreensis]